MLQHERWSKLGLRQGRALATGAISTVTWTTFRRRAGTPDPATWNQG